MVNRSQESMAESTDPRDIPAMFNEATHYYDQFKKHEFSLFRKKSAEQNYLKAVAATENIAQTLLDLDGPKKPTDYANQADLVILRDNLNILPNNTTLLGELEHIIELAKADGFLPMSDRDENHSPSRLEKVEMLYLELRKQYIEKRIAETGLHVIWGEEEEEEDEE